MVHVTCVCIRIVNNDKERSQKYIRCDNTYYYVVVKFVPMLTNLGSKIKSVKKEG